MSNNLNPGYPMPYYNPVPNTPMNPMTPMTPMTPATPPPCKQPIVTDDINYLQGYLNSIINNYLKVSFLIGTNLYIDREGVLKEVGIDYIVLEEPQSGNSMVCDMYSIKFVEVY